MELQEILKTVNLKSVVIGTELHTTMRANDIFALYNLALNNTQAFPKHSTQMRETCLSDASKEFAGGTVKNFIEQGKGFVDMQDFLKEKEKFKDLYLKLNSEIAKISPMRKRRYSEHDGEWSLERQWEQAPFSNTYRTNEGIKPTLKINVDFNFRGDVKSDKITKYGCFVWVIIDAIESSGITCEVIQLKANDVSNYLSGDLKNKVKIARVFTKIKDAGEYVDAASIARCFTSQFYRRGLFTAMQVRFEEFNTHCHEGLGAPLNHTAKNKKGELNINIDDVTNPNQAKIVKAVLGAITRKEC